MRLFTTTLLSILGLLGACSYSSSFDRDKWISNTDVNDQHNPRAKMIEDVMQHHLKVGMSRTEFLALLGKPYSDGIQQRLPKGTILPDSVSITSSDNLKPANQDKALVRFNAYYRSHARPDTLMLYPVGWSIIDPNFLTVEFNGKGTVRAYWVEEH